MRFFIVKQLQRKSNSNNNTHYVTIWSGDAKTEKEAKKIALENIILTTEFKTDYWVSWRNKKLK